MRSWAMAVALLLGAAVTVQATPLDLKQVPDDVKWLAHADVDAMRQSTVVQRFYHECLAKHKEVQEHLDQARERIGMDPRTDLHGITVYGTKIGKDEGVMIVHANVDKAMLLEKAEKAPDHAVVEHGEFKIHTWTHRKGKHEHKVALQVAAAEKEPEEAVDAEDRRLLWTKAAEVLSEVEMTAIWLYYVEEMSARDIAVVVERSWVAVKTILFRARRKLLPLVAAPELDGQPRCSQNEAIPGLTK